jgi:hypothetical protein
VLPKDIIHTAVGRNLEELQRQFVDVGYSNFEHPPIGPQNEHDEQSEA